ncbi:hypothetical protein ACMXYN_06895 [Neptuniibacter sp. PT8_73]|uniref:hypothetical protein n=1 Tax=Neptuniibacter sp. PT8_73 TaxID=3398206 RepID=UPI0039F451E0
MKTKAILMALLLAAPFASADSGSEWLDDQVAQLQEEMAARNKLAEATEQYLLAKGYVVPEKVAQTNEDSFNHEVLMLSASIEIFE